MTHKDLLAIDPYHAEGYPFAPLAADVVLDPTAKAALFHRNIDIVDQYLENRHVIIGRRGSGKTTFLQSTYATHPNALAVEVDKGRTLAQVVSAVHGIPTGGRFPEAVSDIWDGVLQTLLLSAATKKFPDLRLAKDYLAKVGATSDMTADRIAWLVLDTLRDGQKGKTVGSIAELVRRLHSVSFADAKKELDVRLRQAKTGAFILIDSLESEGYILDDPDTSAALKGLLKWCGNVNESQRGVNAHLSIPGEFVFEFMQLSSNPIKDFARTTRLKWKPRDLIRLAAARLLAYQRSNNTSFFDRWVTKNLHDPAVAVTMFEEALPTTIRVTRDHSEPALLYVLRHTQLLPRQFFLLLNHIFAATRHERSMSQESVREAVHQAVSTEVQEIIAAFNHRYPRAFDLLHRAIPQLGETFKAGDLHRSFNRFGRAFGFDELLEYQRLFTDLGVIGRGTSHEDATYQRAQFQYNLNSPLILSDRDQLFIHPLFHLIFLSGPNDAVSRVYPEE